MKRFLSDCLTFLLWFVVGFVFVALLAASSQAGELPRAWNWCTGENFRAGPTPEWQAEQIDAGRPLVPHIEFFAFADRQRAQEYAAPGLRAAADHDLPVLFIYQNLFDTWRTRPPWNAFDWSTDPADHPLQIRASDGKVVKQLSFWSNRTDWSHDLGYELATSDYLKECALLYPEPPFVVFMDNGETGTMRERDAIDDVRVPDRIKRLVELRDSLPPAERIREGYYGNERTAVDGYLENVLDDAMRLGYAAHYSAFREGFCKGLETHSPAWAARFHWCKYGQSGNEYNNVELKPFDRFSDYRYESPWSGVNGGDGAYRHDWGPSGQLYNQPWYGGFHWLRTLIQADNIAYGVWLREQQGFTPPRFQLVWEGRDTRAKDRPTREQWRGILTYWLWVTRTEYFGHFAESQAAVDDERIAVYYEEVIRACQQVHDDPQLRDFWLNGENEPSTAPHPYEWPNSTHPALHGRPWYLLDVKEQDRYSNRGDKWRLDRTRRQPVHVLAFSVRHNDGRRLIYTAGVEQAYESVTVTVPDVGEVTLPAPLGGAFHELTEDHVQ